MSRRPESVVVVGGGVIGLASAYAMATAGLEVTVLERRSDGEVNCSTGNAGMVVPSHFTPLAAPGVVGQGLRWMLRPGSPFSFRPRLSPALWRWTWEFYRACSSERVRAAEPVLRDLSIESRRLFLGLQEELEFSVEQKGLLALFRNPAALAAEARHAEHGKALGIEARRLDASEVAALEPGVVMDIAGAVYFPQDCHLDPAQFRSALIEGLQRKGGRLVWGAEVTGVETQGERVTALRGSSGEWAADAFVMAGGVWTGELASKLGVRLPLQPGKGYSMTLDSPPVKPAICALLMEDRVAVTPMGKRLRVAGTMEIGAGEGGYGKRKIAGIKRAACRYYPELREADFPQREVWSGLRPCSPDGLPYLGRCPGWDNAWVAAGHAMLGLSLAPVSGAMISRLVRGESPGMDLRLLDPGRYSPKQ